MVIKKGDLLTVFRTRYICGKNFNIIPHTLRLLNPKAPLLPEIAVADTFFL
jgi:hypothetical protein